MKNDINELSKLLRENYELLDEALIKVISGATNKVTIVTDKGIINVCCKMSKNQEDMKNE